MFFLQPLALLRRSREEVDRVVLVAVQALKVAGKGPGAQLVLQDLVVRELFLSPLLESFLRSAAVRISKGAPADETRERPEICARTLDIEMLRIILSSAHFVTISTPSAMKKHWPQVASKGRGQGGRRHVPGRVNEYLLRVICM